MLFPVFVPFTRNSLSYWSWVSYGFYRTVLDFIYEICSLINEKASIANLFCFFCISIHMKQIEIFLIYTGKELFKRVVFSSYCLVIESKPPSILLDLQSRTFFLHCQVILRRKFIMSRADIADVSACKRIYFEDHFFYESR